MADTFTFTNLSNNTIVLKNGKEGSVSLTVTNVSGRALGVITSIELTPPDSPAKPWIRVEPAATTSLPRGGTTHFRVFITVPENQPEGAASFKLVVADEFNPHEAFNASPDVAFSWKEVPKKDYKWLLLIAAAVAALVVVGIIAAVVLSQGDDTPRLELREDLPIYGAPDTTGTPVSELASGEKVMIVKRINGEDWYQVMMDNGTPMWVKASSGQIVVSGSDAKITPHVRPSLTPVPPTDIIPTLAPSETPTHTPTSTETSTATHTPTHTPTHTATPERKVLTTQFELVPDSVDYYILLSAPGTIRVKPSWQGFDAGLFISIMDQGGRIVNIPESILEAGPEVKYTITESAWQENKVWRIQILNGYGIQTEAIDIEIDYPNGVENGEVFRDHFSFRPGLAIANIVVGLTGPGHIEAEVNWNSDQFNEALIKLPRQGEGYMTKCESGVTNQDCQGSRMTLFQEITESDLSFGYFRIVSLIHSSPENVSGLLKVQFP